MTTTLNPVLAMSLLGSGMLRRAPDLEPIPDDEILYGDGSGRTGGGLLPVTEPERPAFPPTITRQQRRASERQARKGKA